MIDNPDDSHLNSPSPQANFRYRSQNTNPEPQISFQPGVSTSFQSSNKPKNNPSNDLSRYHNNQVYFPRNRNPTPHRFSDGSRSAESLSDEENPLLAHPSETAEKSSKSHPINRPPKFPSQSIFESFYSSQHLHPQENSALNPSNQHNSHSLRSRAETPGLQSRNLQNSGLIPTHPENSGLSHFTQFQTGKPDFLLAPPGNPDSSPSHSQNPLMRRYSRNSILPSRHDSFRSRPTSSRLDKLSLTSSPRSRNSPISPYLHPGGSAMLSNGAKENTRLSSSPNQGKSFSSHTGHSRTNSISNLPSLPLSGNSRTSSQTRSINTHNSPSSRLAKLKQPPVHPNSPPHPSPSHPVNSQHKPSPHSLPKTPLPHRSSKAQTPPPKNRWHHVYSDHFDVKDEKKPPVSSKTSHPLPHHLKFDEQPPSNESIDNFFDVFDIGYRISKIEENDEIIGKL